MLFNYDSIRRNVTPSVVLGVALGVAFLAQGCSSSSTTSEGITSGDTSGDTSENAGGNTNQAEQMMMAEMMTAEVMMETNTPRDCGSDHPAVGQEAELSTIEHNVSGTVRVIDNCTLQISNFNYDGGGPSVYFWGAVNRDYTGPDYFRIGERIDGPAYENETVVINLPDEKTLSDFDSLSVWCFRFGINFGDAMWNSSP